jgi:hypothetical protein
MTRLATVGRSPVLAASEHATIPGSNLRGVD